MAEGLTDSEIIQGYLSGDSTACKLVDTWIEKAVYSWRDRLGYRIPDVISDIRYELLIALRRNEFTGRSGLSSYLSVICRHTCLDYYRAGKRWNQVELDDQPLYDNAQSAEDKLEMQQRGFLYYRVLRLLPKECIKLWRMRLTDNLKCAEIGNKLNTPEVTVRGRLLACRKKAVEIRDKLLKDQNVFGSDAP